MNEKQTNINEQQTNIVYFHILNWENGKKHIELLLTHFRD